MRETAKLDQCCASLTRVVGRCVRGHGAKLRDLSDATRQGVLRLYLPQGGTRWARGPDGRLMPYLYAVDAPDRIRRPATQARRLAKHPLPRGWTSLTCGRNCRWLAVWSTWDCSPSCAAAAVSGAVPAPCT